MKETEVDNLIINELTKAEFDSAEKSETELYFVTDEKFQASDIEGLETALSSKQDKLTSGTTIKTINGEGVLGSGNITIKSAPDLDNVTISKNSNDELQAIGVIDNNNNAIKTWTGTQAEYEAIVVKDSNTLYNITDDGNIPLSLLELLFPIGAIYQGTMAECPLQVLGIGSWVLVARDRVIQGAGSRGVAGSTIDESLPNITGKFVGGNQNGIVEGAFKYLGESEAAREGTRFRDAQMGFDAHDSNPIYQDNAPVQQDAYLVNIWERIA